MIKKIGKSFILVYLPILEYFKLEYFKLLNFVNFLMFEL